MANAVTGSGNVWPYYASTNTNKSNGGGNEMGKDQFLKILLTQLRNQDPMQPMQDREFIAQMAQFSSLEQMMNMGSEIKMLRQSLGFASGLIGQQVTWTTFDETGKPTGELSGVVDAIVMKDGVQYAKVNGGDINLEHVTAIGAASSDPEEETT
ncbi:flagellar hook assembly protein FlgD [Paenibacillus sp. TRM 82003]|nr:flagellar hook assembly protein FlgD [Paenibacillus sp. TRM 82003]